MIRAEDPPIVQVGRHADFAEDARDRAFQGLVDRRALDAAYRYATLLLGDPADAEDATHDAALTAWRRFGELRDPAKFDAWFGRILVNACRDRLRARRRTPVLLDEAGWSDASEGTRRWTARGSEWEPVDHAEVFARRQALAQALRSLSVEHREVIVLRFYVDLTVDQIAERTGVASGTVKSRLHHALRKLREAVGAEDEEVRDER